MDSTINLRGIVTIRDNDGNILWQNHNTITNKARTFLASTLYADSTKKTTGWAVKGYDGWTGIVGDVSPTVESLSGNLIIDSTRSGYTFSVTPAATSSTTGADGEVQNGVAFTVIIPPEKVINLANKPSLNILGLFRRDEKNVYELFAVEPILQIDYTNETTTVGGVTKSLDPTLNLEWKILF